MNETQLIELMRSQMRQHAELEAAVDRATEASNRASELHIAASDAVCQCSRDIRVTRHRLMQVIAGKDDPGPDMVGVPR